MASSKRSSPQAEAQASKYQGRYPGSVPVHGGGNMLKWERIGQEVIGRFTGIKAFRNGHIANVTTEDGPVAFSAPTMLADALSRVKPGQSVAIVFSGEKAPPQKGQSPIKQFEVYVLPEDEE